VCGGGHTCTSPKPRLDIVAACDRLCRVLHRQAPGVAAASGLHSRTSTCRRSHLSTASSARPRLRGRPGRPQAAGPGDRTASARMGFSQVCLASSVVISSRSNMAAAFSTSPCSWRTAVKAGAHWTLDSRLQRCGSPRKVCALLADHKAAMFTLDLSAYGFLRQAHLVPRPPFRLSFPWCAPAQGASASHPHIPRRGAARAPASGRVACLSKAAQVYPPQLYLEHVSAC